MSQSDSHETYRVAASRLHWIAAALLATLVLIVLAMYWLARPLMESVAQLPAPASPPAPRLQPDPARDLAALRRREQERLAGYGWVDRERGVAHIPIERAMQLLAQSPPAANSGSKEPSP